jgi:hypothetical protein
VLRTARLLRVFKLARSWSELNRIITTILKSFSQVMYLSLLLMLFVFVFALMVNATGQRDCCSACNACLHSGTTAHWVWSPCQCWVSCHHTITLTGSVVLICCTQGMQLFGYKFASCSVDGARELCTPGTPHHECPAYPDCYVPCDASNVFTWINVTGVCKFVC